VTRKRGNNEGTIRKRSDGRWEARITLEDGSRKSVYGTTRQEAAARMAELLRDLAKGLPVDGERQTVREYMISWLATVKPTIESTTWQRYGEYVRLHTIPRLGGIALSRLTPQQVQSLYAAKLEDGLSRTTVSHLHALLHSALNDALRQGLVQRNVCDLVNPPRKRKVEMMTLTPEQARLFLEAARVDRLEALYVVALTTGMREGELFALKWRDVNVDTGAIHGSSPRVSVLCSSGRRQKHIFKRCVGVPPVLLKWVALGATANS
jgi:integrase